MMHSTSTAEKDVGHGGTIPTTILCVDENQKTRLLTKWFLSSVGYGVHAVASAEEALAVFDAAIHKLVVTENDFIGMTGEEMAHVIKIRSSSTPIMMISSRATRSVSCVDLVVRKPISLPALREKLEQLKLRKSEA